MVIGAARRLKRMLTGASAKSAEPRYCAATFETLAGMRDWNADDVIFDIGANDGRSILRWRRHLPHTRIVAFEPVGSTFATLKENTAGEADVTLFNAALGAKVERRTIFLHDLSALNSFYGEGDDSPRQADDSARQEVVDVDTVDAVMAREKIDLVRLMKIDAEGHDLEVLKGASRTLGDRRVDIVQVEAGFEAPGTQQPSLHEIQQYLAGFGYYLYEITNQCRGKFGGASARPVDGARDNKVLVYCDALFVPAEYSV